MDFIIAPQAHLETYEEIEYKTLIESRFGIVMRKDNPLNEKNIIYPMDLIHETFIQRIVTPPDCATAARNAGRSLAFTLRTILR